MADEPVEGAAGAGGGDNPAGGAVTRPEFIPESHWDAEKNAPNLEAIGKDLGELPTLRELKAQHDARTAEIPAKPEEYPLELPKDFPIPQGMKWDPNGNPQLAKSFQTVGKELGWTKGDFSKVVAAYAKLEIEAGQADAAFAAEETKALGEKAGVRREAIQTWTGANLSKEQQSVLAPLLGTRHGVEALEKIVDLVKGVTTRGNPAAGALENKNDKVAERIGTPGTRAMDIFNTANA